MFRGRTFDLIAFEQTYFGCMAHLFVSDSVGDNLNICTAQSVNDIVSISDDLYRPIVNLSSRSDLGH